jgi:hypothetical protein
MYGEQILKSINPTNHSNTSNHCKPLRTFFGIWLVCSNFNYSLQAVKKLNGKDLIKAFEDSDETTCGLVGAKAPPRFYFFKKNYMSGTVGACVGRQGVF